MTWAAMTQRARRATATTVAVVGIVLASFVGLNTVADDVATHEAHGAIER